MRGGGMDRGQRGEHRRGGIGREPRGRLQHHRALGGRTVLRLAIPELSEELFLESLDWARRQEALSWELRTALSLCRRYHRGGLRREARVLLSPIYGRFIEGFETSDLRQAKALIEELAAGDAD